MTAVPKPQPPRRRRLPYPLRLVRARPRLAAATVLAIVVVALLPSAWQMNARLLIGWDAGVGFYLALAYTLIARAGVGQMRRQAARVDEGRFVILVLTVFAGVASLGAILVELAGSAGRTPSQLALATVTIVLSWFFIHTMFALHYAHDFYGERGDVCGGVNFPGDDEPDYWDFVYFSFVIGMTAQVSDVAVDSKVIRRTVTAHGIVSFFFNVALLALVVNIAANAI
jgi:uncharacterized membrane protein